MHGGQQGRQMALRHSNLYVAGLPLNITEDALKVLFSDYGTIISLRLVRNGGRVADEDPQQQSRRAAFAFVKLSTIQEASAAIDALNGITIEGASLQVKGADADAGSSFRRAEMLAPPSDNLYAKARYWSCLHARETPYCNDSGSIYLLTFGHWAMQSQHSPPPPCSVPSHFLLLPLLPALMRRIYLLTSQWMSWRRCLVPGGAPSWSAGCCAPIQVATEGTALALSSACRRWRRRPRQSRACMVSVWRVTSRHWLYATPTHLNRSSARQRARASSSMTSTSPDSTQHTLSAAAGAAVGCLPSPPTNSGPLATATVTDMVVAAGSLLATHKAVTRLRRRRHHRLSCMPCSAMAASAHHSSSPITNHHHQQVGPPASPEKNREGVPPPCQAALGTTMQPSVTCPFTCLAIHLPGHSPACPPACQPACQPAQALTWHALVTHSPAQAAASTSSTYQSRCGVGCGVTVMCVCVCVRMHTYMHAGGRASWRTAARVSSVLT